MNSRLNCLDPPALSCLIVSISQVLSVSVRKVAFSGFCEWICVRETWADSEITSTDVVHVEVEYGREEDCH